MALNSFITEDGAEMGRAQVMQAEAAKIRPDARMNPILLKPTSDVGSQVIVNGHVLGNMPAASYFKYKKQLVPEIMKAYRSLEEEYDIIVIEGAGSPAEINLKKNDIVNMGMAKMVDAPVLLAGDIDRGGVFAQLYGTVALLEEEERKRVKGLIINKFRGDVEILKPGLATLEELTKIPVAGVIPWIYAKLDDEDSLAPRLSRVQAGAGVDIAVVRLPHISNFTDFNPLEQQPGISLRYAGDVKNARAAGYGDCTRKQKYDERLEMDAPEWYGSRHVEACGSKRAGAGNLRGLSDAGRKHRRPGRGRRGRKPAWNGAFAG